MSAAALLNIAGFALCCIGTARTAVDATFADRQRGRIGSAVICAISLLGVIAFMARVAAQGLA